MKGFPIPRAAAAHGRLREPEQALTCSVLAWVEGRQQLLLHGRRPSTPESSSRSAAANYRFQPCPAGLRRDPGCNRLLEGKTPGQSWEPAPHRQHCRRQAMTASPALQSRIVSHEQAGGCWMPGGRALQGPRTQLAMAFQNQGTAAVTRNHRTGALGSLPSSVCHLGLCWSARRPARHRLTCGRDTCPDLSGHTSTRRQRRHGKA